MHIEERIKHTIFTKVNNELKNIQKNLHKEQLE